jgi:hypothetical protein
MHGGTPFLAPPFEAHRFWHTGFGAPEMDYLAEPH